METLYKRAKTGKIVSYNISIEPENGEKYPIIVKLTGQLDGKKTEHREVVKEGKQKRSRQEQAEAQALSDWNRKRDEGYKSLADLGITDHGTYVSKDGQDLCLEEMLDVQLPEFNTDAADNVKPMLAKTVDWNKVAYPCLVQPKLDGVRCLMVVNKEEITFLSRNGKPYTTLNHISDNLWKSGAKTVPDNFILDGEIYSDELTFQQIIAVVKKQRDDSLKLKFRAYDIVNDETQEFRWATTFDLVQKIDSEHIIPVITTMVDGKELTMSLHDQYVQQGYEGAMIRLLDGKYGQGQRSSALLKVKEFDEAEFAFKNFEFGQRGVEDLIAVCWNGTGEKEFRAKMVGTRAEKEELYELNDTSEGKSMTIKHFGLTTDGLPRFPIGKGFRHDI